MTALRRHLRAFAWLALFTMGSLVVAPVISRTLAWTGHLAQHGAGLVANAPVAGHVHHHGIGPADSPIPSHHSHTLDHCELCGLAAVAYVVVPTMPADPTPIRRGIRLTVIVDETLPAHDVWPAAAARGPPRAG